MSTVNQRRHYRAIEAAALAALIRHSAAAYAAYAAYAAARAAAAAGLKSEFIRCARRDFESLRKDRESLEPVIQSRLWPASDRNPAPNIAVKQYDDFALRLHRLDLDDIAQRFKMLFSPMSVNVSLLQRAVDEWYEEYQQEKKHGSTKQATKQSNKEQSEPSNATTEFEKDAVGESKTIESSSKEEAESTTPNKPTPPKPIGLSTQFVDRPARKDLLGREPLVFCLSHMFASEKQDTPFTLALLGDWGAGKSSVMQMIEDRLKKEWPGRCRFALFNAWEYEKTENMGAGLAQEVVKGLFDELSPLYRLIAQVIYVLKRLRKAVAQNLLLVLTSLLLGAALLWWSLSLLDTFKIGSTAKGVGIGALLIGFYKLFTTITKSLQHPFATTMKTFLKVPQYREHLGMIPVLREQLCDIVPIVLKLPAIQFDREPKPGPTTREAERDWRDKVFDACNFTWDILVSLVPRCFRRNERLIVWGDDLDRCDQDGITATLEAVRLIMEIDDVIVCIAVDQNIALRAIAEQYETLASEKRPKEAIARDYLGKIIQLPIRLGRPPHVDGFIDGRLFTEVEDAEIDRDMLGFGPDEENVDSRLEASETNTAASPTGDLEFSANSGASASHPESKPVEAQEGVDPINAEVVTPDTKEDTASVSVEEVSEQLDEIMQHNEAELFLFKSLSQHYGFTNPRRLARLHNSYRLLKLLNSRRKRASIPATTPDQFEKFSFLHILFWEEFLHQEGKSMHDAEQLTPWKDGLPEPLGDVVGPIRRHFRVRRPGRDRAAVEQLFSETRKFAERLVLPLGETTRSEANDAATGRSSE